MLAFDLRVSNVYLSYLSNAYVGRQEYPCTSLRFVGLIGLSASFGGSPYPYPKSSFDDQPDYWFPTIISADSLSVRP